MEYYQGIIIFVYLILSLFFGFVVPYLSKFRKAAENITDGVKSTLNSASGAKSGSGILKEYINKESLIKERDELIFDLVKGRYEGEIQRWDGLDSKAGSLIGFFSIVTSLTLAAGSFNLQGVLGDRDILVAFFLGIGLLLTSIVFSLVCFRIRETTFVPNTEYLFHKYGKGLVTYRHTLRKTCGEMSKAVVDFELTNNDKANWIGRSWTLFVISLGYLFILFILFTLTPQGTSAVEELAKLLIDRLT